MDYCTYFSLHRWSGVSEAGTRMMPPCFLKFFDDRAAGSTQFPRMDTDMRQCAMSAGADLQCISISMRR